MDRDGPQGPVDVSWLILQRRLGAEIASLRNWSLVLLLLAILGLLAKLLIPGA